MTPSPMLSLVALVGSAFALAVNVVNYRRAKRNLAKLEDLSERHVRAVAEREALMQAFAQAGYAVTLQWEDAQTLNIRVTQLMTEQESNQFGLDELPQKKSAVN